MNITIQSVSEKDYEEIYQFENRNKAFFEQMLPPRSEAYYQYDTFKAIMEKLQIEQNEGQYHMYIIRNEKDAFVGRINLQISVSEKIKSADLGYRMDYEEQGNGYASEAIALVLRVAFEDLMIYKVTAGTAKNNAASQKVLEKNGFQRMGEEEKVLKINNTWVDGVIYSIALDEDIK